MHMNEQLTLLFCFDIKARSNLIECEDLWKWRENGGSLKVNQRHSVEKAGACDAVWPAVKKLHTNHHDFTLLVYGFEHCSRGERAT